jgi:hypothetical protein
MPQVSHHFITDRPIDQRDLDFPDLGPQIAAVMDAQSQAGVASLAQRVEHQIPA